MPPEHRSFDAVVVGAGTAGSASALFLARAGLRVALVEKQSQDEAGARWQNGIPPWMFERAGLDAPAPPEDRGRASTFWVADPNFQPRLALRPGPITGVNMPRLVARLHELCRRANVGIFDRFHAGHLELDGGRPAELSGEVRLAAKPIRKWRLHADLFVDASGLSGILRRQVPALSRFCPPVPLHHLCTAAQVVCTICDRKGADGFLEKHRIEPGDMLAAIGMAGGFSTTSLMVDEDLESVELLTGSIADGRHPSGPQMMSELRGRHAWIGKVVSGGAGLIPLRRPFDRLVAPGIALVGDSACQVFPAHGSGTGAGLIAARQLADAVAESGDPGAEKSLFDYQTGWHRGFGAVCAAYDVFRRYAQSCSREQIARLLSSGLLNEANVRPGLEQTMLRPGISDLLPLVSGLLRAPRLAGLLPVLARMAAIHAVYKRFPLEPDPIAFERWAKAVGWLMNGI